MAPNVVLFLSYVSFLCISVDAKSEYVYRIPNGNKVIYNGRNVYALGHYEPYGGGPRNVFGMAFVAAGRQWTQELCMADSDGDGQSNGVELGDPDCKWLPGTTPSRTTDISHPAEKYSTTSSVLVADPLLGDLPVVTTTRPPTTTAPPTTLPTSTTTLPLTTTLTTARATTSTTTRLATTTLATTPPVTTMPTTTFTTIASTPLPTTPTPLSTTTTPLPTTPTPFPTTTKKLPLTTAMTTTTPTTSTPTTALATTTTTIVSTTILATTVTTTMASSTTLVSSTTIATSTTTTPATTTLATTTTMLTTLAMTTTIVSTTTLATIATTATTVAKVPSQLISAIKYGDRVTLKSVSTNKFVGTFGGVLKAIFTEVRPAEIFEIGAKFGDVRTGSEIKSEDMIVLTTSVGNRVSVQGDSHPTQPEAEPNTVHNYWDHMGDWQDLRIEKHPGGKIYVGDQVSFRGHMGNLIGVVGDELDARKEGWYVSMNFILDLTRPADDVTASDGVPVIP